MYKKVLSETALYYGSINMPKNWDIDRKQLAKDILVSDLYKENFKFSIDFDILNTYIKDHINVNFKIMLINKNMWGNIYKPKEASLPLKQIDPVDLKNSPDFVLLYGVNIFKNSCYIRVHFDDNRRAGRYWDIPINNNTFVMFPSTQMYYVSKNESNELNFIQTITYEYI
jgi:hypothetical protein